MQQAEIGIIGGSGLYSMPGLSEVREVQVATPFGDPSDSFILGKLEGRSVAFLARHGRGHKLLPSELNFRANIYAMKALGVERIVSVSAVGSLKEEHKPTDFVMPDQFIDRTFLRTSTFFGQGVVGHVAFGDPVCAIVSRAASEACAATGVVGKLGGTYVCMEGPQFSTKAESNLYRSWGADVVGMTNLQEAKLAREAEICYATIAMVTFGTAVGRALLAMMATLVIGLIVGWMMQKMIEENVNQHVAKAVTDASDALAEHAGAPVKTTGARSNDKGASDNKGAKSAAKKDAGKSSKPGR